MGKAIDSMSGVGQEVELERSQENNRHSDTLEVEDVVSADTNTAANLRTMQAPGLTGSGMVGNERDRGSELYKNRIGVDSAL